MENIIYNELRFRGYKVDVGVVECRDKDESGKEIILVEKRMKPRRDENGYVCMGIKEFLLDAGSLEF